jgi:hypothetical protein
MVYATDKNKNYVMDYISRGLINTGNLDRDITISIFSLQSTVRRAKKNRDLYDGESMPSNFPIFQDSEDIIS